MTQTQKPIIYWILQDNQITPFIVDFLKILKQRLQNVITVKYLIPSYSKDVLEAASDLDPVQFQMSSSVKPNSYEGFCKKRDLIKDHEFSEGLLVWQTLLLDDLGSGNLFQADIHLEEKENIHAIILQLPTPLGSASSEERIFYSWVFFAKQLKIPIFGYELLPLDTRWSLAPSLLDGVITTNHDSHRHLTRTETSMENTIWLLPRYEGRFFTPGCSPLWRNGLNTTYKNQAELKIDPGKTIIYLPHNVAMIYEYKNLISYLKRFKDKIHLMFSIGKDQTRGTHKHNEMIEIVSREDLKVISHSFHDLSAPWEMAMADCVAACASCYTTSIASNNNIPTIIYDPMISPNKRNAKETCNNISDFLNAINEVISAHKERTEIAEIFFQITKKKTNLDTR